LSYINPYPVTKEVNHEQYHSVCVENGSFFINIQFFKSALTLHILK